MKRAAAVVMAAVLVAATGLTVVMAAPAAAAIAVTVDPSTGLVDGQPVTVTGTGFAPHASGGTAQCSAAVGQSRDTVDCDLSTSKTGSADDDGTASFVLRLKRVISTANGDVDCATAAQPCVVGMGDLSDLTGSSAGMAVTFDPDAPPLPPPSVSVSPDTDLVDRQQVAVTASGFIEGESVIVLECAAAHLDSCAQDQYGGGYGQADPTGSIAVGITVRRVILVGDERLDCASAPGACVVTVQANGGPRGTAPLAFDDSIPLPPPPSIIVTPDTGLADRQVIDVAGSGFVPHDYVILSQCESGSTPFSSGCASAVYRQAEIESDGTFETTMQVRTKLDTYEPSTGEPRTVDCAAAAGACDVNVIDGNDSTLSASAPLAFDPNAPALPAPTASVSPSSGLVDGQTVDVSAHGMPPGASVVLVQCKAGTVDQSGCDLSSVQTAGVDDQGDVAASFTVKRILNLSIGPPPPPPVPVMEEPVTGRPPAAAAAFFAEAADDPSMFDCGSAPAACNVVVAFLGATIDAALAPLTFDASAPVTTVPVTTVPGTPGEGGSTTTVPGGTPTGAPGSTSTTAGVAAATSTTARSSGATGPLARTGAAIVPLLQRVGVLLLLGGVIVLSSRRRRRLAR
jgi:hypothetical protein